MTEIQRSGAPGVIVAVLRAHGAGATLGLVEYFKEAAAGKRPEAFCDAPSVPSTSPPTLSAETRPCAQCGGAMRGRASGTWTCDTCGYMLTVSRLVQNPVSRREYLARTEASRRGLGRGTFGRFGH